MPWFVIPYQRTQKLNTRVYGWDKDDAVKRFWEGSYDSMATKTIDDDTDVDYDSIVELD